jgi:hypothetical protein
MYVYMYVLFCLDVCPSGSMSVYLSVRLSVLLSVRLSVPLTLSISLSVLSVRPNSEPLENGPLDRSKRRHEDNIKIHLRKVGCEDVG